MRQSSLSFFRTRFIRCASRQLLAFLPVLNVQPGGSGSSWDMRSLSGRGQGVAALLTTCTKTPFYCRCIITCVSREADFTLSTCVEKEFGNPESVILRSPHLVLGSPRLLCSSCLFFIPIHLIFGGRATPDS